MLRLIVCGAGFEPATFESFCPQLFDSTADVFIVDADSIVAPPSARPSRAGTGNLHWISSSKCLPGKPNPKPGPVLPCGSGRWVRWLKANSFRFREEFPMLPCEQPRVISFAGAPEKGRRRPCSQKLLERLSVLRKLRQEGLTLLLNRKWKFRVVEFLCYVLSGRKRIRDIVP